MTTKITIKPANWLDKKASLLHIRNDVFITEQHVPKELEIDGKDGDAFHWIASNEKQVIGCIRMLKDGHIGRMAVLKGFRHKGYGTQLLNKAIAFAQHDLKLSKVYLDAQIQAVKFYRRNGFKLEGRVFDDAGIPHVKMRHPLKQIRQLGSHAGKFYIRNYGKAALSLAQQAKRQLYILNYDLSHDIFNSAEFCEHLSTLARAHRHSEIKILVIDIKPIIHRDQRLLSLQRKLSSSISIRQIPAETIISENILIADNCGIIIQSHYNHQEAWGDFSNIPTARTKIDIFEHHWQHSTESPELRLLEI